MHEIGDGDLQVKIARVSFSYPDWTIFHIPLLDFPAIPKPTYSTVGKRA
jgi:NADPH:quinone reductase-like Zn-dependent oxidoreductase